MTRNRNIKRQLQSVARKSKIAQQKLEHAEALHHVVRRWYESRLKHTTIKDGDDLEKIVSNIYERIGVPDLVSVNPKYARPKSQGEIADAVVLFEDNLIAFHVKMKTLESSKEAEVVFKRAEKLIDEAVGQFSILFKLLKVQYLPEMRNLRGIPFPFQSAKP